MQTAPAFEVDSSFAGDIGMCREDMTPEAGIYCHNWGASRHEVATSIHRPLFVYAMACRDAGTGQLALIVTLDYGWFQSHTMLVQLRRRLLEEHGLTDEQLLLIVTHSHSVPHIDAEFEGKPGGDKIPAFRRKLLQALSAAVRGAIADLSPAILSWSSGQCALARRRAFTEPQSGRILCGPNPNDTADATLLVGRITGPRGEIRGTVVNYACHPVSLGPGNTAVSPDYVGALRATMESHTAQAPCMFIHGASGDQTPRDSYADDPAVADRNGESVGYTALAVLRGMLPPGQRLEFAREQASGAPLALFEMRPYAIDPALRTETARVRLTPRRSSSRTDLERRLGEAPDAVERVRLSRLANYLTNLQALGDDFPIWGVRLGRAAIIGTPAEPFTDLQRQLRERFVGLAVIVANDTNGTFNYLPPRSFYGSGAYEEESADFGPGSLEKVIDTATTLIERMLAAHGASA
jgi:hypothetical protein